MMSEYFQIFLVQFNLKIWGDTTGHTTLTTIEYSFLSS